MNALGEQHFTLSELNHLQSAEFFFLDFKACLGLLFRKSYFLQNKRCI